MKALTLILAGVTIATLPSCTLTPQQRAALTALGQRTLYDGASILLPPPVTSAKSPANVQP